MRKADLDRAKMQGTNLEFADLDEASLISAQLQGAVLEFAGLQGADLREVKMQNALLWNATMQEADLRKAEMQGADLREADMQRTNLAGAKIQETILWGAKLTSADAMSTNFSGSLFMSANLSEVRNLTQAQLEDAIGDGETILPIDADTGRQLYVWSCWETPPEHFERLMARIEEIPPWLRPGRKSVDELRAEWLCDGRARVETGRPVAKTSD